MYVDSNITPLFIVCRWFSSLVGGGVLTALNVKTLEYDLTKRLFKFIAGLESNYDEVTDSFDAMDLKPDLLRGM